MIDLLTFFSSVWADTLRLDWPGKIGFAATLFTIFGSSAGVLSRLMTSRLRRQIRDTGQKYEAVILSQANQIQTLNDQLRATETAQPANWFMDIEKRTSGKSATEIIALLETKVENASAPFGLALALLARAKAKRLEEAELESTEDLESVAKSFQLAAALTNNMTLAREAELAQKRVLVAKAMS